jgi:A/G-specific adenine glycosylase
MMQPEGILASGFDVDGFRAKLLEWWAVRRRSFPWRDTRDPYALLVAEVLLHRTRAEQVAPLYLRLLQAYSSIDELASAAPADLHQLLKSAGLRWRVDLLHNMAKQLVARFGSVVPSSAEELQSLPGVGHYISAAVRSFAFGIADVVLDTNTVRIVGRLFLIPVTDASRRSKRFRGVLEALLDPLHPREFNLALLDHAALICTARKPKCEICPVSDHCLYGRQQLT